MISDQSPQTLLQIHHLVKHFPLLGGSFLNKRNEVVHAVDGVSINIIQEEIFGLIGETGSGKTTLAKCIMQLIQPTSGMVIFKDKDLSGFDPPEIGRRIQLVTQDAMEVLNPKKNIREIIGGNLRMPGGLNQAEVVEKINAILMNVCINPAWINRYPHELSGAEKQRLNLARSLAYNPPMVIYDDPFSMQNHSILGKIFEILTENHCNQKLTYLIISHDLTIIQNLCTRVAVMYLGEIIEQSTKDEIIRNPMHPFTKALISAIPVPDPSTEKIRRRILTAGKSPSNLFPPPGCRFSYRCPIAEPICAENKPELKELALGHLVSCHLVD